MEIFIGKGNSQRTAGIGTMRGSVTGKTTKPFIKQMGLKITHSTPDFLHDIYKANLSAGPQATKGNPTIRSSHSWLLENVHSHDLIRKYYYAHQVCTYSMFIHNDNIRSEIELPSS